jgi:ABC-type multidrug transport system ATPase subunit
VLVSIMHANNEVGTLQPVREIAAIARERGVLVHTDAAQSLGKVPVNVEELGVDLLTVAGHKLYAPKGIGVLYVRRGVKLEPLIHGAGHENARRAGTENVPYLVGLGAACEIAKRTLPGGSSRRLGPPGRPHIATRPMDQVDRSELIRLMVGRELSAVYPKQTVPIGEPILELRGVGCRASSVRGIDLTVRAGEIVGLAGLVGAGRTELARVLFGLTQADAGEIVLCGKKVAISSPTRAIELGIAYVPEDRRRHGVILDLPVAANTSLAVLKRLSAGGRLSFARERILARSMVERLAVKTPSIDTPVSHLSGGNQQKVAVARWLATEPTVLILDEPTQGIDVGAKAEIHRLMGDLASHGLAILLISSELPEILGMSDRIAVMHAGTIAGTLERAEATQERVLSLALGHEAAATRRAG